MRSPRAIDAEDKARIWRQWGRGVRILIEASPVPEERNVPCFKCGMRTAQILLLRSDDDFFGFCGVRCLRECLKVDLQEPEEPVEFVLSMMRSAGGRMTVKGNLGVSEEHIGSKYGGMRGAKIGKT